MTIILKNEVVVTLQNKNTVVPLYSTDTVYPKVDSAGEVEPESSQPQVPN